MTNSTLIEPMRFRIRTQDRILKPLEEKSKDESGRSYKIVFLPSHEAITPLKAYEAHLRHNGVSEELIADIIEGLSESPLYESKSS